MCHSVYVLVKVCMCVCVFLILYYCILYNDLSYSFYVVVIKACKLKASDPNGKSDPYCIISLDGFGSEFQTKVCPATLDPEWNEAFSFIVDAPQSIALGNEGIFAAYLKV